METYGSLHRVLQTAVLSLSSMVKCSGSHMPFHSAWYMAAYCMAPIAPLEGSSHAVPGPWARCPRDSGNPQSWQPLGAAHLLPYRCGHCDEVLTSVSCVQGEAGLVVPDEGYLHGAIVKE